MMTKFWELFEQSVIVQSVLTLIIISAYVYLLVTGQEVSTEMNALATLILGFWFGSKAGYQQGAKAMRTRLFTTREEGE
jgi:hypothetical protein